MFATWAPPVYDFGNKYLLPTDEWVRMSNKHITVLPDMEAHIQFIVFWVFKGGGLVVGMNLVKKLKVYEVWYSLSEETDISGS